MKGVDIVKRILILISVVILAIILSSCRMREEIGKEKHDIVLNKYGEVEYIIENIFIYKNLSEYFDQTDELNYLLTNRGNRGSVSPELRENFYVIIDIIKHEDEYKILVYDNLMKIGANKTKMFLLVDYFLPLKIDNLVNYLNEFEIEQDIKNFNASFIKKDSTLDSFFNFDLISMALFNKHEEESILLSFHDNNTGNTVFMGNYSLWIGNVYDEVMYYPSNLEYQDLMNHKYDTLEDDKVSFSLNKGNSFIDVNNRLEVFDIWGQAINSEVRSSIFFYAFTYLEFLEKVEIAKNPNIYTYKYPSEEGFNNLVNTYDETYFEDNILIFYYKYEPNISENYVYSVTKKDQTLTVNINRFSGMETALSGWLDVITIKKSDIEEINKVDLIVRTISKPVESVHAYIKDEYMRDFYLNPKTLNDFESLNNISDIEIFTWSLNVDLFFNKDITDADLERVLNYLDSNSNVKSVGYVGKDKIRMQMENRFYDEVKNKTLKLKDFFDNESLINEFDLSISILKFSPIASITFILEEKGKDKAEALREEINKGYYPYLTISLPTILG